VARSSTLFAYVTTRFACRHRTVHTTCGVSQFTAFLDSRVGRLQALAYRVKVCPTDGPPDQPTILLALSVSSFQLHAGVMLLGVDVLASIPAPLQLLAGLVKQRHELAFVVERSHDLMPPLVPQRVVCIPAHHPAIDLVVVWIDLRHRTSIALQLRAGTRRAASRACPSVRTARLTCDVGRLGQVLTQALVNV